MAQPGGWVPPPPPPPNWAGHAQQTGTSGRPVQDTDPWNAAGSACTDPWAKPQQGTEMERKASNPGSKNHGQECKPCNKFDCSKGWGPENTSCKHGDTCDFCHEEHTRPKHRGQRGRHALQRRQFLENRDSEPIWIVELVDGLYKEPHAVVEKIKAKINGLGVAESQKIEKAVQITEEIRDIGENAQYQRPDSMRLRGQRIAIAYGTTLTAALSEMDGRCKWLIGTLHLMVRKMRDAATEETKAKNGDLKTQDIDDAQIRYIQETTRNILARVAQLPELIDQPRQEAEGAPCQPPEWLQEQAARAARKAENLMNQEEELSWLEAAITRIAMDELARCPSGERAWNEGIADQISQLGNVCHRIPSHITRSWKRTLEECSTLGRLACTIEDGFIEMICDPVKEHVAAHPETREDITDLADEILRGLPFEAKFLDGLIRKALTWTLDQKEGPSLEKIKKQLEEMAEEAKLVVKLKMAYKPLWPSNVTAERVLAALDQGSQEGIDLTLLRVRLKHLMDAVTLATKPLHAPNWATATPQGAAQDQKD